MEIQSDYLLVLETTCFTNASGSAQVSFKKAQEKAEEAIRQAGKVQIINISVLRPPQGDITPLDSRYEPEANRAIYETRCFALGKQREVTELTHLMYGLITTRGPVITRLFESAGISLAAMKSSLDNSVKTRHSPAPPVHSKNLNACLRLAEDYAWQNRNPGVREIDLIWALLEKGSDSTVFNAVCRRIDLDLNLLQRTLETFAQRPRSPFPSTALDDSND